MKSLHLNIKPIVIALFAAGVLSACGGGGGGGGGTAVDPGQNGNPPPGNGTGNGGDPGSGGDPGGGTPDPNTTMTMSCVDGAEYQCSGGTVLQKEPHGVILTRSGVQVFGISTGDIGDTPSTPANPTGFALPSASSEPINGVAEVRVAKPEAGSNNITRVGLLLDDFGITWDGKGKRPQTIESFLTSQGRVELDSSGKLVLKDLPLSSDTNFYDFLTKGAAGATQAHYANNTYFPRDASNPPRCPQDIPDCATRLTQPIKFNLNGTWNTNGIQPDWAEVGRYHEDGDVHAGNGMPDATGPGVPFPGSKGYRGFTNLSYEFTNLTAWNSQDTVLIADWTGTSQVEHNKERRGMVAFGNVTQPNAMPTTGTATYTGWVYGLYGLASTTQDDPDTFVGQASVEVNYETGAVKLTILDTKTFNAAETPVPAAFTADAAKGVIASTSTPNYFTGTVNSNGLVGGVSGRYFGPAAKEIGGTFQLTGPSNATIIGGFMGRKP